jgi:hypothetical protein
MTGKKHWPRFKSYQMESVPGGKNIKAVPLAYCRCNRAIVFVAGVWWHLEERRP